MRLGAILGIIVVVLAIIFGIYMVDFDVTDEGEMPDVDVSVEGGEMPEVDAQVGDIDVGTQEVTIEVPDVDVQTPEEEATENN
jgi:hypothetical protein